MRGIRLTALVAIIAFSLTAAEAQAKKKKSGKKPSATVSKSVPREIPQSIVQSMADGDLSSAVIALREEPPSPKVNYLIRTATAVVLSQIGEKPAHSDEHQHFQNLGIAYHNLFLFLKARGIANSEYFDSAVKNYKKARRAGTVLHKAECDLLTAAILAANGNREKAQKMFEKIDEFMLRADFESTEYLAAYYAAMGDAPKTSDALKRAFDINPSATLAWIEVGDDFHEIESDPSYKELLASFSKE